MIITQACHYCRASMKADTETLQVSARDHFARATFNSQADAEGVRLMWDCPVCNTPSIARVDPQIEVTRLEPTTDKLRRAVISIYPDEMRQLLDLPPGYRVEEIFGSMDPAGVRIIVSSPELEPVPPGAYYPMLEGWFQRQRMLHLGKVWTRWGWSK